MTRPNDIHWLRSLASAVPGGLGRPFALAPWLAAATAVSLALAAPVHAQSTDTTCGGTPAPAPESTAPGGTAAGTPTPGGATTDSTGAAGTVPGGAAMEEAEAVPFEGQIVTQEAGTYTVSDLMGATVTGMGGEKIGEVEDLIMSEDGKLMGVVVGVGGFLGIGEKQVAIDLDHATPNMAEGGSVVVQLDKTALEQAPEFVELEGEAPITPAGDAGMGVTTPSTTPPATPPATGTD